jgi:hypothetical protein
MVRRVIRYAAVAILLAGLLCLWLLLRQPSFPAEEPTPEAARSFAEKVTQLTLAHEQGFAGEIHLTEAEINSQIAEGLRDHPPPAGAAGLKGAKVRLEGDRLVALLTMNMKGRDVYVTVGGKLDFTDHSVRLLPSEVRVGSFPVPVSWVASRIDMHMDVPEAIGAVRLEDGELVVATQ